LKKIATRYKKTLDGFDDDVMVAFQNYGWPGNVRELETQSKEQ